MLMDLSLNHDMQHSPINTYRTPDIRRPAIRRFFEIRAETL
jgi:hypothetical protein